MDEINAITGQPRNVVAFPVIPRSGQCGTLLALPTSTAPSEDADRGRFAKAMGQCLALVAPSGMAQDARRVWMEAAFAALRHLPIDVIEKGAIEAQRTADHPSKIVPAVIAATEQVMAFRRRMNAPRPQPYTPQALPSPEKVRSTESELDAICKRFGVGRYSKHDTRDPNSPAVMGKNPDRKCRAPTREDYIKLFGIDPEAVSNGA